MLAVHATSLPKRTDPASHQILSVSSLDTLSELMLVDPALVSSSPSLALLGITRLRYHRREGLPVISAISGASSVSVSFLFPAVGIDNCVTRDLVDPTLQLLRVLERFNVLVNLEKDLLQYILGRRPHRELVSE